MSSSEATNSIVPTAFSVKDLSQHVRTITCDWLFQHVLPEQSFGSLTADQKQNLFSTAFCNLMDILTVTDLAEESSGSDLADIVLDQYASKRSFLQQENPLYNAFVAFSAWMKSNKANPTATVLETWGFSLLRVVDLYFLDKWERNTFFNCISKARSVFSQALQCEPSRVASIWGLGLTFMSQARLIQPSTESEISKQTSNLLLSKAQEKLSEAIFKISRNTNLKSQSPFLGFLNYQLARVYGLLGDTEGCLFYLTKARATQDMPSVETVFNLRDFSKVAKSGEFATILFEDAEHTRERLAFEEDLRARKFIPTINTVNDLMASVSLRSATPDNMTESMWIRHVLSKSTMDFLVDGNLGISINWKAFFQPVITPQDQSTLRLNERMKEMNVKPSPNKIPGDGNCQMHSLSDQLCGNLKHHVHIRRRLVSWLRANSKLTLPNGATLDQFANDQSWNDYCNSMLKLGTWGDHLTLIAAAEVFKTKIVIISSVPGDNYVVEIVPVFSTPLSTLYLSHLAEFHYSSVLPM